MSALLPPLAALAYVPARPGARPLLPVAQPHVLGWRLPLPGQAPERNPVSFARFLTWLVALVLTCGAALVVVRYGFGNSDWGSDAVWAVVGATLITRPVHDALVEMWSKP